MLKYIKRLSSVFSGNAVFAISSLVVASILVSKNGLEQYGLFIVMQSLFHTWAIATKPLTWQSIVKHHEGSCLATLMIYSLKLEVKAAFVFLSLASVLVFCITIFETSLSEFVWCIATSALVSVLYNNGTVLGYLRATRRFHSVSIIQGMMGASRILLAFYFYYDIKLLFVLSLITDFLIWFIASLFLYFKCFKGLSKGSQTIVNSKEFNRYAIWGTLHSLLDLPFTQLDKVIVSSLIGLEVAGVLNLLRKVSGIMGQIADPIYQVLFPELSAWVHNRDFKKIRLVASKVSISLFFTGLISVCVAFVLFDFVNALLFEQKLLGYKVELCIAILIQTFNLVFIWVHPLFISFGFMKETAKIVLIANLSYVLLLFFASESLGVLGALAALFAQALIVVAFKLSHLNRRTEIFTNGKRLQSDSL